MAESVTIAVCFNDMAPIRTLRFLNGASRLNKKTMLLRRKQNRTLRLAEKAGKVYIDTETLSWFLIQPVQKHLKTYRQWAEHGIPFCSIRTEDE
jgi:hypothetical protein